MLMMIGWLIVPLLCMILVAIYIYRKVRGAVVCFLPAWTKKKQEILSGVLAIVLVVPALWIYGTWVIILLHITAFLLIIDGIALIVRKIHKGEFKSGICYKIYKSGIIAILMAALMCGYGRYNIFHVVRTEYTVQTQKNIRSEGYKLVLLSDLHYGVTMNDAQLQEVVDRINNENADIIVLDGDIVDESTTFEQMKSAFRILGQAESKYGVYYVYGNHDKNNYASKPNYTAETLADTIRGSGIKILEDDTTLINQEVVLIGRADWSDTNGNRKDISTLVGGLNNKQEWIVLDHQPAEYENVEKAGADLILSGHTHAGQIWPAGLFASILHFDDLNYGKIQHGNLNAIVTSGIAGWAYPIRTEKHSEYVVLNIMPEKN